MRLINAYIFKNLLVTLLLTVGISSFMMVMGNLTKVFDFLSRGVKLEPLLMFLVYKFPQVLSYTIPLGILIATILVFTRMSADGEITALLAGGISFMQITAPVVMLSIALCVLCGWLQFNVAPDFNHRARWLVREVGVQNPLAILEPGHFREIIDGHWVSVDSRDGDQVRNIRIYIFDDDGSFQRNVRAERGTVVLREREKLLELQLDRCTIVWFDAGTGESIVTQKVTRTSGEKFTFPLDYGKEFNRKQLTPRVKHFNFSELMANIALYGERGIDPTELRVELHQRAALALAPFSFILLGVPLGIRLHRRETSPGLLVAVLVIGVYYALMTMFESFQDHPEYYPHLLMWLPNIVAQLAGLWTLWRRR